MEAHAHLKPGETCGECGRRVPYPKQETSPKTKTVAKRVPVDEADAHEEIAVTAAKFVGVFDRPHWRFWLDTYAYARLLQDEEMRGVANRRPS